jgi:hypothetical protein
MEQQHWGKPTQTHKPGQLRREANLQQAAYSRLQGAGAVGRRRKEQRRRRYSAEGVLAAESPMFGVGN